MTTDRLYPIIALILLAGATFWLERITRAPEEAPRTLRTDPDFIGDGIRMTAFDEAGRPDYELLAERILHFPASDVTEFEEPRLLYETPEGKLRIRADRAEASAGAEDILLNGEVVVHREGVANAPDMSLESNSLRYWPDTQRASTTDPVIVKHGNIVAYGNGLQADNLAGALELLGDARVQMPRSKRNRQ